jgi:hypothetical protein
VKGLASLFINDRNFMQLLDEMGSNKAGNGSDAKETNLNLSTVFAY